MVGLDTNILVRFVTRDDAKQWAKVSTYLEANCTKESPGWVALIVLCELLWVLESGYEYEKKELLTLIETLLTTAELKVEEHDVVRTALTDYTNGKADFSDYIIGRLNIEKGCAHTISFDKKASKNSAFILLK